MKKRFIAYAIFFTLLGGYTIFMYATDFNEQQEKLKLEEIYANQPKSNYFHYNIDKIKSGEIKVQNYIYPTYIPAGYEYNYDGIFIDEDSKYYDEGYESNMSKSLSFDLKDSLYSSRIGYVTPYTDDEYARRRSDINIIQNYVDSKDIYKNPYSKSVFTLENFQKDRIKYDKKDPYLKILEFEELSTQDTIFDKIFYEKSENVQSGIEFFAFKKIDPINEYDYLLITLTIPHTSQVQYSITKEEAEKIIKGFKVS